MTTCRASILAVFVSLLLVGSVWAQENTDWSGAVPMSDASGVLSTQSDQLIFQSDEAQVRMADVASTLALALREGILDVGVASPRPIGVPDGLADLFLASSRRDGRAARVQFGDGLMAAGIPKAEAQALVTAAAGLLKNGTIQIDQFLPSLHAFNEVVNAAPAAFLVEPPASFVVVRAVLMSLLDGSAS